MIYTFYSYKGGVGRTHLLANIAAYLCYYKKRKILLIDWDLEAPGLHFYFGKRDEDIKTQGLLDLLNAHIALVKNAEVDRVLSEDDFTTPFAENEASEKKYIQNLINVENGGKIDLMPAICYEEGYHSQVEDFDWLKFYDQLYGGSYLLWFREQVKSEYDYVLIDSRTGFHDYSGICNVLMPDMNLVIVAPNQQNFDGAKKMVKRIIEADYTKSGRRKPFVLPILARLDDNRGDEADEWRAKFASEFALTMPQFDINEFTSPILRFDKDSQTFTREILEQVSALTTIRYESRFALGEKIYFNSEAEPLVAGSSLENFENIALFFLEEMNENGEINLDKIVRDRMILVYRRKINQNSEDYESWFGLGYTYDKMGNYPDAKKSYLEAINAHPNYIDAWNNLGNVYFDLEEYELAAETFQKATVIDSNIYTIWNNLGVVHIHQKKYNEAKESFEKALNIDSSDDDAYFNLACVYSLENNRAKSLEYLQKAINLDAKNKASAKKDKDFEWLWNDPDFLALVQTNEENLINS
ncbi:MAG: tetratricopeptide repeat protein [Microscillaceae bacterium]|jgi:tetratricopeptide (TPR) repeat protein|nr:tetratricopeptide repeat protein [Microscillaceae bacterium]